LVREFALDRLRLADSRDSVPWRQVRSLHGRAITGEQAPVQWIESWLGKISPRQALAKNAGV
jgi:hypothetical protein